MIAMAASQMKNEARRTPLASSSDAAIRITVPPQAKMHWRTAKWNGSEMFIRAAAAGLVAKAVSTPMPISAATMPSSQRSMVHHQTPSLERSDRAKA